MLTNVDHTHFLLTTITTAAKSDSNSSVLQLVCQDGQVVTTDRDLVLSFSPFLRSAVCSTPTTDYIQVLSLPDASSEVVESVLNMINQSWIEDIYVLRKDQVEVLRLLDIPVGDLEKVQILEFSKDIDPNIQNSLDYLNIVVESEETNAGEIVIKCPACDFSFGEVNKDTRDELSIHIGEIHNELELLTEFYKLFPGGSNQCNVCSLEVTGEYVQKEHVMLQHPWPMLKASVEEITFGAAFNVDKEESINQLNKELSIDVKQPESKVSLLNRQDAHKVLTNANNKASDNENNKAKEKKRGRKRKSEAVGVSERFVTVFPAYVPQRKSAKKASLSITKHLEGEKKYKQQDIGKFMKVKKLESKFKSEEEHTAHGSKLDNTRELIEDIDKLLQDSDEEANFGEDVNYETSSVDEAASLGEIDDMQGYLEFSDSEGEEDEQLNYSIKVENKSFTDNIEEESDLPEIQGCIEFSDSDNED